MGEGGSSPWAVSWSDLADCVRGQHYRAVDHICQLLQKASLLAYVGSIGAGFGRLDEIKGPFRRGGAALLVLLADCCGSGQYCGGWQHLASTERLTDHAPEDLASQIIAAGLAFAACSGGLSIPSKAVFGRLAAGLGEQSREPDTCGAGCGFGNIGPCAALTLGAGGLGGLADLGGFDVFYGLAGSCHKGGKVKSCHGRGFDFGGFGGFVVAGVVGGHFLRAFVGFHSFAIWLALPLNCSVFSC